MLKDNKEKIDVRFRNLTDLFFCTDRKDLDLSEFRELLSNCDFNHINYFIFRFDRATSIFWEDNLDYWFNRFCFLLSINNKKIKKEICFTVEERFLYFIERVSKLKDNLSIIQYVQLCCARKHLGFSLDKEKRFLLNSSNFLNIKRFIEVCELFIPIIWKNKRHLMDNIVSNLSKLNHGYKILEYLRKNNYYLDNKKIAKLVMDLCVRGKSTSAKSLLFFNLLNNKEVYLEFKSIYTPELRTKLYEKVNGLGTTSLTYGFTGINIINMVINIDSELSEKLIELYITNLYSRYTKHKKANVDRIVKFIKEVDAINPKNILVCLTKLNKQKDIKKLIKTYPELKKLSLFV